MRLATFQKNGIASLGVIVEDWMIDLEVAYRSLYEVGNESHSIFANMLNLLQSYKIGFPLINDFITKVKQLSPSELSTFLNDGIIISLEDMIYLAPILNPGKLICVGLNYPSYKRRNSDQSPAYPVLFHKVATSLVGHGGMVLYPQNANGLLYEGELALVIGMRGKYISRENACSFIAGYTIANDIGSPDLESRTSQWTTGKMLDTFCPLGPFIVTCDEVKDPNQLQIRTYLNGDIVQDGNSSEMIFDVPYLVSYLSSLVTLEPGDVILTGSPKRNGDQPDPRKLMKPGDEICVDIECIGKLCNPIVAEV